MAEQEEIIDIDNIKSISKNAAKAKALALEIEALKAKRNAISAEIAPLQEDLESIMAKARVKSMLIDSDTPTPLKVTYTIGFKRSLNVALLVQNGVKKKVIEASYKKSPTSRLTLTRGKDDEDEEGGAE